VGKVLIVNQRDIPASFDGESLFVNGVHILDADESTDLPIEDIAANLAVALGCEVERVTLTEEALARSMSKANGTLGDFLANASDSNDFDEFIQGYTNEDVLRAVKDMDIPVTSTKIADFLIQDWHLIEIGAHWTGPREHRDTYRFVIEQSPTTHQIYFKVYPVVFDTLSKEVTQNGLAGVIEIRNGKPGMSVGTEENDLPVHIESNVIDGLYIHCDGGLEPKPAEYVSFDHGMTFDALFYRCNEDSWLMEARSEIADKRFDVYDFGDMIVVDDSGWEIDDTCWKKSVYFENPTGGDSIKGLYQLEFASDSTVVLSESGQ
jgi:hypothetical protein